MKEITVTTNVVEEVEREFEITLKVTQHHTAIFAGFQQGAKARLTARRSK